MSAPVNPHSAYGNTVEDGTSQRAYFFLFEVLYCVPPCAASTPNGCGSVARQRPKHTRERRLLCSCPLAYVLMPSVAVLGLTITVTALLARIGLAKYAPALREAEVDMEALVLLREADLRELGLPKGPRVKLMHTLREEIGLPASAYASNATAGDSAGSAAASVSGGSRGSPRGSVQSGGAGNGTGSGQSSAHGGSTHSSPQVQDAALMQRAVSPPLATL